MSARKDDVGKPPLSLIPRSALLAEARVMAKGRDRYGANNWRSGDGLAWSRLIDAALRHISAFADGEDRDNGEGGSGELHLANARCCLAFLIEYYEKGLGKDDRYKAPAQKLPDIPKDSATNPPLPFWELWASGGKGPDCRLGAYSTKANALQMMGIYAPDWPTFLLYIKEVKDESTDQY